MAIMQHRRVSATSMFQNGISQNTKCDIRPPIVDLLFPVTCLHCNFRAVCIFIITFGDYFIKLFVVTAMLLSVCVVISLGAGDVVSGMVYY